MSAWLASERSASFENVTNAYRARRRGFASITPPSTGIAPHPSETLATCTAQRVVRVTQRLDAPPRRAFLAWLEPDIARKWLFAMATQPIDDVAIDARVGGAFRLAHDEGDEHVGRYLEIIPHRRLAFALATPLLPATYTQVQVDIAALRRRTVVTLSHSGVPSGFLRLIRSRWLGMLYGLAVTLDAF